MTNSYKRFLKCTGTTLIPNLKTGDESLTMLKSLAKIIIFLLQGSELPLRNVIKTSISFVVLFLDDLSIIVRKNCVFNLVSNILIPMLSSIKSVTIRWLMTASINAQCCIYSRLHVQMQMLTYKLYTGHLSPSGNASAFIANRHRVLQMSEYNRHAYINSPEG